MKGKKLWIVPLCALLSALTLTLGAAAAQYVGSGPSGGAAERTAAVMMVPQGQGTHDKYMGGDGQGMFYPERALTRAELAQMLYGIVADRPASVPALYDVAEDAWYAPAAETAAGLGLMTEDYGAFRPNDPVTRAECAYALSQLLPYDVPLLDIFPDVWPGYWAYQAICRTAGRGLFVGDGSGEFRPNDGLTRCEAVAVFNRLLGRSPDLSYLQARGGLSLFADVPTSHWAYGEIMEAAVPHQYQGGWNVGESWLAVDLGAAAGTEPTAPAVPDPVMPADPATPVDTGKDAAGLPDGPQRIDGHLYWVVDGKFARGHGMEGLWFDDNGWYTTGDAELDALLNGIVERVTDASMSRDQKLRALFDYVVKNYTYLARPMVAKGTEGWEPEYAKFFLQNGKGNCFSFAAAYCLLCRELGLPAYTVVGASGNANSPHGWVEISLDGSTYMFDPELQWYYNVRTTKTYDLFKMLPSKVPSGVYRYIR